MGFRESISFTESIIDVKIAFDKLVSTDQYLGSPMTIIFIIKFGWDRTKTVGEVAFWKFGSHRVHVNKNKNKKCKNLKIKNFENRKKNGLEIGWIGSFPQNLAWIHAAVSEKPELTDDGQTHVRRQ